MISLSDVSMGFGVQVLFEHISWRLDPGKHYGLVGANGTGKSTLLKLMSGEISQEKGEVSRPSGLRVGVLGQDHFRFEDVRLMDVVMMGRPVLWAAMDEKHRFMESHEDLSHLTEAEGGKLANLEAVIADNDGYVAEAAAGELLEGLGLPTETHERAMSELSGGFRLRVLLAQTLFSEPELLLLDEPTNHLDIVSIRWLENHLRAFPGTLVLISHDRHFLNSVCTHIADIDYQELRLYTGNYDKFLEQKELSSEQKEKEAERTEKKIAEMQQFVDRFKAKATKARQAQSRAKRIEKMEKPEIKRSSRMYPKFVFTIKRPSGKEVYAVKDLKKSYGDHTVLNGVSFQMNRGEKIAVVGPNGVGKSTLLKLITEELKPDEGILKPGYEVSFGYFAQDHRESLEKEGTVYDWLYTASPVKEISVVRGTLGRVLFTGDDAKKKLGALSGGESARLHLSRLMLRKDNLLLLDEPTNHLDLEGREALMMALQAYQGSLIFVSHDRHFVSDIATRVLALSPEGMEDFHGTYEEYLAREGTDFLTIEGAKGGKGERGKKGGNGGQAHPVEEDYETRKNRKRETAKLKRTVETSEKEIARLESVLAKMDEKFADPTYFDSAPWDQISKEEAEKKSLKDQLETTVKTWEQAAEKLEAIKG